jgi:outer membrane immunogenic protein
MRNTLISNLSGAAFILSASGFAFAADLAVRAPLPPPPAPIYDWTGFYVGGNVGGTWSTTDWTFFNGPPNGNFEPFSQDTSSWIAGGQVGYRYQLTPNWVLGVEASWSGTDLKDTSLSVLNAESKITDLLLVTGSVGYAVNNWLTYVKGGYANANVDFNTFVPSTGGTTTASDNREGGWTVGGGFEYGFTPYISAGIEYDFSRINIGDRNQIVSNGFSAPETVTSAHADFQTVMARLNFQLFPFGAEYQFH